MTSREKTPTAEEIMQKHLDPHDCLRPSKCYGMTLDAMIEFAKIHVEAALKAASETKISSDFLTYSYTRYSDDKDLILNAYSLDNIK